jgi:16S rRNA processing protein RimM
MASARNPGAPASATTLPFGVLGRPHGVRGEIVLHPFNPQGARLERLRFPIAVEIVRADRRQPGEVLSARPFAQGQTLLKIAGAETREAVAALTNAELHVARAALPPLEPGELYVADLVGCEVYDLRGVHRGRVRSTFWNGSQDVLAVVAESGEELLIPAVPGFIHQLDLAARTMVIDDHEP